MSPHDHAAGLRVRQHPAFGWVVEDGDRVIFAAKSRDRCQRFVRNHAEARATWCGCAGTPRRGMTA